MATNDVPGYNPSNNDELNHRSWAESSDPNDGSLILVISVTNGKVVFFVYDIKDGKPPLFFMDSMHEDDFKKFFSWDSSKPSKSGKWVWHDKTEFPVERILKNDMPHGQMYALGEDQMSQAERLAQHFKKRMSAVDLNDIKHKAESRGEKTTIETILSKIGRAIDRFVE